MRRREFIGLFGDAAAWSCTARLRLTPTAVVNHLGLLNAKADRISYSGSIVGDCDEVSAHLRYT